MEQKPKGGRPRIYEEPIDKQLTVPLRSRDLERIRFQARAEHMPMSAWCRRAILGSLEDMEKQERES